jgi:hypothetical protein
MDFSEASPLTEWTEVWNAGNQSASIINNTDGDELGRPIDIAGKQMQWTLTQIVSGELAFYRWDTPGDDYADVEILVKLNLNADDDFGLFFRASGSAGAENGYFLRFDASQGSGLYKRVAGAQSIVDYDSAFDFGNDRVWARVQAVGSTISWKIWNVNNPEPDDWTYVSTDTDISGAGGIGLAAEVLGGLGDDLFVDYISVGTGGEVPSIPTDFVEKFPTGWLGANYSFGSPGLWRPDDVMVMAVKIPGSGRKLFGINWEFDSFSDSERPRAALYKGGTSHRRTK